MQESIVLKKQFGQNFIQSSEVIDDILHAFGAKEDDFVIEIGPGAGALTDPLASKVKKLKAIEIDPRLVIRLRDKFSKQDNVEIIADDVLQVDLQKLSSEYGEGFNKLRIVGNIPYNITSPIIEKVLTCGVAFENFTLMIQKEVAERICAQPGTRKRGYMSVFVQYYTQPTYIRDVGKELFMPIPKVDSAVVNLEFRKEAPVDCDKEKFFDLVKRSFSQKRKTLANNLVGYIPGDKKAVSKFLEELGIDPLRRAESLSLEEFAKIVNAIK